MTTLTAILDQIRQDLRALSERSPDASRARLAEDFFLSICRLGKALEQDPALRDRPEIAALLREIELGIRNNVLFLESFPSDVVFTYQTTWDGGEWEQLCRYRSAIQFFVDLTRDTPIANEISAIHVEIEDLDDHLRRWGDKEGGFAEAEPGIPASHWWWLYPSG